MDWLTWFPGHDWQHWAFALALLVTLIASLMAVKPRLRRDRSNPI